MKKAVINDFNKELINVYQTVQENPEELISDLKTHENESDYFYNLRALDREARLMTKFDFKSQLPEIFSINNFSILPISSWINWILDQLEE